MIDLNKDVTFQYPQQTIPWLEVKLSNDNMKHLWKMVEKGEKRGIDMKPTLEGNISTSFTIDDTNHYFTSEVLLPLAQLYQNRVADVANANLDLPPAVDVDEKPLYPCANRLFL